MTTIYLDNNSTTRLCPEAVQAMSRMWHDNFGNPSSAHRVGQAARHAVEQAREQVADLIGAAPREIIFTSGGTEADNLAIRGVLAANTTKQHIVTTSVEHDAVFTLCEQLAAGGHRVSFVPVDPLGHLDLAAFEKALSPDTALASVMLANNETGVLFPIPKIARLCAARGIPLHVDAVQALGKLEIDVRTLGAQLVSLSAHKVHGPKGVGALYVGKGVRLRGQQIGGHQERDIRPGTENAPGIVGFGAAAAAAKQRLRDGALHMAAMRDRLEAGILDRIDIAEVIGDRDQRTPNTTNVGFRRLEAEAILVALSEEGVCASSGSACHSGSLEPSRVLRAMGIDNELAHGAVRFSVSYETTPQEIDAALQILERVIGRLRELVTPLSEHQAPAG